MSTDTGSAGIPRTMHASVLIAPGQIRDEERPVPVPAADEVLIEVASVGVCGSDVHYYREGITAVRGAGTVVLVGMGADEIALPIPVIQNRELTVTGVFRYTGTWPVAAHLAATGQVDLASLVTGRFGLGRAEEALNADLTPGSLKAVVRP